MATTKNVTESLRARIASGEFPPGSTLPGTPELQRQYKAALHTVRGAQRALREEGLIETRQGHPTTVLRAPAPQARSVADLLTDLVAQQQAMAATIQALQQRLG
jgi:DNA-binding FadR family transcriptional regulator